MVGVFSFVFLFNLFFLQQPERESAPDPQPEPQTSQQDQGFRIDVTVDQVFLAVNARHRNEGGFVRGLQNSDFQVFEDGVKQEIVNFYSEAVPVHVVLLVDISGSTADSQNSIRRAALTFARSLGPDDRVAIVTFNDAARLILDWTNDIDRIQQALGTVYAKSHTAFYDALYVTFDDLLAEVEGRKAVILLTDGVDNGSMVNRDDVLKEAIDSGAMVYVVSTVEEYWAMVIAYRAHLASRNQWIPKELTDEFIIDVKRFLNRLASQTGGRVLETTAYASYTDVFAAVAEELKNQYYLSYTPVNIMRDGRWRNIEVRILQPGVTASTRPGYQAPLDPAHATP